MNPEQSVRILYVEDHEDTREAMLRWFRSKRYEAIPAHDKKSCLDRAAHEPFDILICDLQLPDGNGWELMQELRVFRDFVGIAASGHCTPADRARSKAAGFLEHIVKPYSSQQLSAVLERAKGELAARSCQAGSSDASQ